MPDGANQENATTSATSGLTDEQARAKLRSWLGKVVKVVITDERVMVGCFLCTDPDGNIILENTWEYSQFVDNSDEPRIIGLVVVPGKHIVSISLMT